MAKCLLKFCLVFAGIIDLAVALCDRSIQKTCGHLRCSSVFFGRSLDFYRDSCDGISFHFDGILGVMLPITQIISCEPFR